MTPTSLPFIGVVMCGFMDQRQFVTHSYISAIVRSGGCPIVLPCTGKKEASLQAASICHGFLFCGGGDVTPLLFDRPPLSSAGETDFQTDLFQLSLTRLGPSHISQRGCGGILYTQGQGTTAQLPGAPGILNLYPIVAALCCGAKSQLRRRPQPPYRH